MVSAITTTELIAKYDVDGIIFFGTLAIVPKVNKKGRR